MLDVVQLLVLGLVGAVSVTAMQLGREASLQRKLRDAPRSRIVDVAEGTRACVVGTVASHAGTVTAPFSGTACVYYEISIEKRPRDLWEPVYTDQQSVVFAISDDSGHAIVDPDGADVSVGSETTEIDDDASLGPSQLALRARASDWLEGRMRVVERRIEAGDVIAVVGGATREPDPAARPADAYRGESPTRLRLASSPRNQLLIKSEHLRNSRSRNRS
jgi:hypothetical protein